MPTSNARRLLTREISKLNKRIDAKILTGKPYKKDAHIHKLLLSKLRRIDQSGERTISLTSLLAV